MASPSVLCVLPCVPLPATSGGRLRTLAMVQALDAAFDTTVLALHSPRDDVTAFERVLRGRLVTVPLGPGRMWQMAEAVAALGGRSFQYARYRAPELVDAMLSLLHGQSFDFVHFDHLHMAQAIDVARQTSPRSLFVLDAHNVEHLVVSRVARTSALPMRFLLLQHARRIRCLEARVARSADLVIACSGIDALEFTKLGANRTAVIPNHVEVPARLPPTSGRSDVVFIGSLDWMPNADAARRLIDEIWPRCRAQLSPSRLVIVGRAPPQSLRASVQERICITGEVPSVQPWLRSAWATAIPLRSGSGTRIKILEAWAAGVPVIASRVAAEGLPFEDGVNGLYAETSEGFAATLIGLSRQPLLAGRLRAGGFAAVQRFDRARVAEQLLEIYASGASPPAAATAGQ